MTVYWTWLGRFLGVLMPLVSALASSVYSLGNPDPLGWPWACVSWVLAVRAARSGLVLADDRVTWRGVLVTRSYLIDAVQAIELTNEATPMAIGSGLLRGDVGVRLRLKNGRGILCPSIYGPTVPPLVRIMQQDLRARKTKARRRLQK